MFFVLHYVLDLRLRSLKLQRACMVLSVLKKPLRKLGAAARIAGETLCFRIP